ncbi:MAG: ArsR family transcriptional regulator [Candidatus Heimdallarchaeota archaeon]|nr:ArsR family transcriptional regulator [Candidatus Heimdallarchaeota archaeon]
MEVHIATIGYSKEPVLFSIRTYSVDKLFLLHTTNKESMRNTNEIIAQVKEYGIFCDSKKIDPFNLEEIVLTIMKICNENRNDKVSINITGGTKIMASAALLTGFILGLKVYYFLDDRLEENKGKSINELLVELPIPQVSFKDLESTQREIIVFLLKNNGSLNRANFEIYEGLNLSKQNTSYHLKQLANKGLIELELDGRTKKASLTNSGLLFARILSRE